MSWAEEGGETHWQKLVLPRGFRGPATPLGANFMRKPLAFEALRYHWTGRRTGPTI
jgi:hypothetical protein